jgi:hypothetical protein
MFMSGGRSTVFGSAIIFSGFLLARGLQNPTYIWKLSKKLAVPVTASLFALYFFFSPAVSAFWTRANSNTDEFSERAFLFIEEPLAFSHLSGLDGYGTGSTHQARTALRSALNLPPGEDLPTRFEQEAGRIILELGPIGFLMWYSLRLLILAKLFLLFLKLKSSFLKELALSVFFLHLIQIRAHLVFNHTISVYYWFTVGFIFLLPQLERNLHASHRTVIPSAGVD